MATDEMKCQKCGGANFRRVTDEWMRRSIPWTGEGVVRQCENCGEKHFSCPKCFNLPDPREYHQCSSNEKHVPKLRISRCQYSSLAPRTKRLKAEKMKLRE